MRVSSGQDETELATDEHRPLLCSKRMTRIKSINGSDECPGSRSRSRFCLLIEQRLATPALDALCGLRTCAYPSCINAKVSSGKPSSHTPQPPLVEKSTSSWS
ncbi:hypothetical protein CBOM_07998 [Ceraceosorus bombacis]|uniref:Uncharacterized protein n=1 Tax=Ceraceosorus bombacis TaxID=401625 RepID=A0A0P1BBN9_9BASI|nr:hypothetical protein CBOM_07998 [Ceraceosorus bombacis]